MFEKKYHVMIEEEKETSQPLTSFQEDTIRLNDILSLQIQSNSDSSRQFHFARREEEG